MTRYIVKRVLLAIVSVFIICAITFFAMNAIPGGPFNSEKALSEATKQVLEQRYNLDKPVPVQFVLYLKNLLHGDFGVSLKTGRDNKDTLLSCFKVSGRLGLTAAVLLSCFMDDHIGHICVLLCLVYEEEDKKMGLKGQDLRNSTF